MNRSLFVLLAMVGLGLTGCGGGPVSTPAPAPATPISVSVSPATASVQVGQQVNFAATVMNDSANKGVTWALSGVSCSAAKCGSVAPTSSISGATVVYTASPAVPSGTIALTATSISDSTKTANATITITAGPSVTVSVSPTTASLATGGVTQTFASTVQNDSQNKGVTWTLSGANCSGATCGSVSPTSSSSGAPVTYTSPATASPAGAVTLNATSVADVTKSAIATITITSSTAIVVALSPTSANVTTGGVTQTFTSTLQNDTQNKGVSWVLAGANCSGATCGTVSPASSLSGAWLPMHRPRARATWELSYSRPRPWPTTA